MAGTKKSSDIGLKKAALICNMPADRRVEFIAEGLPILFESAKSLIEASQALVQFPREAEILERHCEEECAKILILVDIIRCPKKRVAARVGPMIGWFYDHLARLIYAEAQSWKPMNARQLQEYIDTQRKSHYLEGEYGEFIMENWALFQRESSLYADVVCAEDADPVWISPARERLPFGSFLPISFQVVDALEAFGVLTKGGLKAVAEVWGRYDVEGHVVGSLTSDLYTELVQKLDAAGLISGRATSDQASTLSNTWQLPMYNMNFAKIVVPLEQLRGEREASFPYYME